MSEGKTELWDYPPPILEWEEYGLLCWVIQGPYSINGYVVVTSKHPLYGVEYMECPQGCEEFWCGHTPENIIDVHGGLTFSTLSDKGWVFGFDTAHYNSGYWSVEDVEEEVKGLARQLGIVLLANPTHKLLANPEKKEPPK